MNDGVDEAEDPIKAPGVPVADQRSVFTGRISSDKLVDNAATAARPAADTFGQPASSCLFDRYIMIDWSSRSVPAVGEDSVWLADVYRTEQNPQEPRNFDTREACIQYLIEELQASVKAGHRVLVGFDFAFGYPLGVLEAMQLQSWRDLIQYFRDNVHDHADNQHNRDDFARAVNQFLGDGPGPFWGPPTAAACNVLPRRRVGFFAFPYAVNGILLHEFRHTEHATRIQGATPQSVWKLNQGVSVGGQTIMGIGRLSQLLHNVPSATIWPQLTGWGLPPEHSVVVAEKLPSLIPHHQYLELGHPNERCRDSAQMLACCHEARRLDLPGELKDFFAQPENIPTELSLRIAHEEGWILWS